MSRAPHAELATSPLANCTDQLTGATRVKLHSLDTWARIFDFGTGPGLSMYLTPFDDHAGNHGMRFAMFSPTAAFDMFTPTPPIAADDTWHHVAVTVTTAKDPSDTVTMYVDGAVV